jgi:hypothetical protein
VPSFVATKLASISIEIHVEMALDHFGPISIHSSPATFEDTFESRNLSARGPKKGCRRGGGWRGKQGWRL